MIKNFILSMSTIWQNITQYMYELYQYPVKLISVVLDVAIVLFIIIYMFKIAKNSRVMQLAKGILTIIVITWLSDVLHLTAVHSILTAILPSGVLALIVIFQPEIRRALEQIGTNKFVNFFGMNKDIATRTKEDIYKIVIAVQAACILPLANNRDISKELGTRHRAAVGISKESDAIAIVVSEESGKVSIAKDGTLIADVKEDALKKILIKNIVTDRLENKKEKKINRLKNIKKTRKEQSKEDE